jgi:hypothetical protein
MRIDNMIAWRPKAALSHLPPLRLTREQFAALSTEVSPDRPHKIPHQTGALIVADPMNLSVYRPVIVVRADSTPLPQQPASSPAVHPDRHAAEPGRSAPVPAGRPFTDRSEP